MSAVVWVCMALAACDDRPGGEQPEQRRQTGQTEAVEARNPPARDGTHLKDAASHVVAFLRGETELDPSLLADSVTLYIAPEGGGERRESSRRELQDHSAWRVGGYDLRPPPSLTELTTRRGSHFNCFEAPLASLYPGLAGQPHIGVKLAPPEPGSCLQTWNMTLVFGGDGEGRITAVVYDQWEW